MESGRLKKGSFSLCVCCRVLYLLLLTQNNVVCSNFCLKLYGVHVNIVEDLATKEPDVSLRNQSRPTICIAASTIKLEYNYYLVCVQKCKS